MYIWRRVYNPFRIGGKLHHNIKTEIDTSKIPIIDLGKGFKGIFIEKEGKSGVYELESGGLVGDTVEQVMEDINSCDDIDLMRNQVSESKKEMEAAKEVSNEFFFVWQ